MKTSAVIRNALIVSLLFAVITPTSAVERICAEINHEISKDLNDKDRIAERTSMCFDGQVDKQLDREHPTLSMYEKADKNRTPVAVPSEALNPTDLKRMGVHVPAAERSAADEPTSIPVDRKSGAPRFEMLGERNHCSQVNVPHAGSGVDPIDGKTGNAQLPQQIATVQTDLRDVTEQARGQELVETVEAAAHEVAASAESDGRLLSRPYQGLPLAALGEHFERARKALADTADLLDQAEGGLPRGEIERFKRVFLNAKDKAEIGLGLARDDEEARKGDQSLFQQLTVPREATR